MKSDPDCSDRHCSACGHLPAFAGAVKLFPVSDLDMHLVVEHGVPASRIGELRERWRDKADVAIEASHSIMHAIEDDAV